MMKNKISVDGIQEKIWRMFDILKNESIPSEEYYIILFLLTLYKEDILSTDLLQDQFDSDLLRILQEKRKPVLYNYSYIYKEFESTLKSISSLGYHSLIQALLDLDKRELSERFSEIFDNTLYRISQSHGKYGGEFIQPVEVTKFMCSLAGQSKNLKVFNPFAGLASFAVFIGDSHDYLGQEINHRIWALGALRLHAHSKKSNYLYVHDDSILNWPNQSKKFDLIISNPPQGKRFSRELKEVYPDIKFVEELLIKKGVKSLNSEGKLIVLLSQFTLFSLVHREMRKRLIDKDLIDTIISLPAGVLSNTGSSSVILVIDKKKKLPGKIRFIDSSKFVDSKGLRGKIINEFDLRSVVQNQNQDSDVVRIVENDEIRKFDYNLSVRRYYLEEIDGIRLGDILNPIQGNRRDLPSKGKLIRIRDLKDDVTNFYLDLSKIDAVEFGRHRVRSISVSSLLIATRWNSLKPTLFKYSGTPIYLSNDVLPLTINNDIADPAFLINELRANYVEAQLEAYRTETALPMISKKDLLNVVIKLPSLEEQKAKMQGVYETSDRISLLQEEHNAINYNRASSQFDEIASLKHTLGRPRQNILDWADNLIHFFDTNREEFDTLNNKFFQFYEMDILSSLNEIKRDINFMTEVLEKGENGLMLEDYEQSIIPLSKINRILNDISGNGLKFRIKKVLVKGEKLNRRGIYGNPVLLNILINNILMNADKHGFENKDAGNEVVFELLEIGDFLSMEIRNNGKPFPNNFDRAKLIRKYSTANATSGTGLGGYDIHRIATEFNNSEWKLILNDDPIYPVKFKFQFPIKLID